MNAIVIGGGTNGLAAATRLARAGRAVLLLEAGAELGGVAASVAFHPGFRSAGFLDVAAVDALGAAMGLVASPQEEAVSLPGGDRVVRLAGPGTERLAAWIAAHRPFLAALLTEAPPRIDPGAPFGPLLRLGMTLRRSGVPRMREVMRIPLLTAEDWLAELGISPEVRGLLEAPALVGGVVGPRQPTTAGFVLLSRFRCESGVSGPAAVLALAASARSAGVEIRVNSRVARIRTSEGAVRGVTLADGTVIDAPVVLAAIDPRFALLELLDPWEAGTALRRAGVAIRGRGAVAQLLIAASRAPSGPGGPLRSAWLGADPVALERAFDRRKYDVFDCDQPSPLHVTVPSASDPALAPPGSAVVSIRWTAAPTEGWTAEHRERTSDAMVAAVDRVIPDFSASVVASRLIAPPDLKNGVGAAHPFHVELAFDQLWAGRPGFGLGQYATPITGLYLASAGTHPGGGVAGTPGWLAAGAVR